ncbi:hypothetical protein [Bacillus sp. PS06]|uniref:hypothetical protein n=1 Tax=Bacillus sp. PS06 TaxID=2764176 RepID=UPI00177FAE85|nr:hypothetical protein [Bacillus sp. PS06]MBD8071567.1 hypothetical protein [Bacillus sp. PS06]
MLKFIVYLAVFSFFGYKYYTSPEDSVFTNIFVILLSLFIFIFLFEWLLSLLKKKASTLEVAVEKEEAESFDELLQELTSEYEKTWNIKYEEHDLMIVNKYNKEHSC